MIKRFFLKIYNSPIFKRVMAYLLCFVVAVMLFFASIPSKVRADVFSAVALGTSALGALVSAYLATAGVQFSGSGSADGDFLGNYVSNWVKNSPSFSSNPYFDSSGNFVGSSDDVSVVQNNDNDVVSLIFGKEFAVWLEALKQSFVSDKQLSPGTTTTMVNNSGIIINGAVVPYFGYYENIEYPTNRPLDSLIPIETGTFNLRLDSTHYIVVNAVLNGTNYSGSMSIYENDLVLNSLNFNYTYTAGYTSPSYVFRFQPTYFPTFDTYYFSLWTRNRLDRVITMTAPQIQLPLTGAVVGSTVLDGALTDGYSDFQDAINQDLTNADEENVAVVDVGSFPDSLSADQIADIILDRIIADELNPTYEGIRENMQDAEEEQEGERPFIPQYPSDWVIINGIQNFFPFCIPWDLAYVFNLLQAEPEAPRFTWRLNFGKYADPYDVVIDFAPFETVAVVFRTMMVVVFLFFLIKKTRELIRG